MLKVNYSFRGLQPIYTGSDQNSGTEKKLRREKVQLKNKKKITSNFISHEDRREAIVKILQDVWNSIDFKDMPKMRLMGIWDEFTSKVLASSQVRTKEQFLNKLCEKLDIRSIENETIIFLLEKFDNDEFLSIIRDELQYLILKMKLNVKQKKDNKDKVISFFDEQKEEEKTNNAIIFEKHCEEVPYISGNSIRGYLRRLLMYDFCKLVGITQLDKNIYHQLFTGGNITGSTGNESIETKEQFILMCPAISLLGSAIGNQTLEGDLKVSGARLKCIENGSGDLSFYELIETRFQTRLDSSKTENIIELLGKEDFKETTQMLYQYEVFITGSEFSSLFAVTSDNELTISCFYRMLELWKENNFIVGNSARDCGLIELDVEIPENASKLYLDYLENNKDIIKSFFKSKEVMDMFNV